MQPSNCHYFFLRRVGCCLVELHTNLRVPWTLDPFTLVKGSCLRAARVVEYGKAEKLGEKGGRQAGLPWTHFFYVLSLLASFGEPTPTCNESVESRGWLPSHPALGDGRLGRLACAACAAGSAGSTVHARRFRGRGASRRHGAGRRRRARPDGCAASPRSRAPILETHRAGALG